MSGVNAITGTSGGNDAVVSSTEHEHEKVYEFTPLADTAASTVTYDTVFDKTTFAETGQNTYSLYNYYTEGWTPPPREPLTYSLNTSTETSVLVTDITSLQDALTNTKPRLIYIIYDIEDTTTLTRSPMVVDYEVSIIGNYGTNSTITFYNPNSAIFNVTSDNVHFVNLHLKNIGGGTTSTCINFTDTTASNNIVERCTFTTNESAIFSANNQIQIVSNTFKFDGPVNSHRYMILYRCTGETLIYDNTFDSNQPTFVGTTQFILMTGSSADFVNGHLVVKGNTGVGCVQRLGMTEISPVNFTLSLINNNILTNNDFWIVYGANTIEGFKEITVSGNTVELHPGSSGFKGLIGVDQPSTGTVLYNLPLVVFRASLNTAPSNFRSDYAPIPNASSANPVVGYRPDKFTLPEGYVLNIRPPLVAGSADQPAQTSTSTPVEHDHGDVYALADHSHTGTYAVANHNHDGTYLTGTEEKNEEPAFKKVKLSNNAETTSLPDGTLIRKDATVEFHHSSLSNGKQTLAFDSDVLQNAEDINNLETKIDVDLKDNTRTHVLTVLDDPNVIVQENAQTAGSVWHKNNRLYTNAVGTNTGIGTIALLTDIQSTGLTSASPMMTVTGNNVGTGQMSGGIQMFFYRMNNVVFAFMPGFSWVGVGTAPHPYFYPITISDIPVGFRPTVPWVGTYRVREYTPPLYNTNPSYYTANSALVQAKQSVANGQFDQLQFFRDEHYSGSSFSGTNAFNISFTSMMWYTS